ncbi:MAG: NAD(P)-dependent dehydrogenase (short-subunit alcohol dehydrogenase family) [Alphaproteobacteria bacterium]|jgi:NAD(P)-dependent dehydrogenase (short-subunit alcohol dehydrogenase family)
MKQNPYRNALVTGGERRIGAAIARALAADGLGVAIHSRRSGADADALVAEIIASGGRAATVSADLADEEETAGLIEAASAAIGPIDCLVNNASLFEQDSIETATRDSWNRHLDTNLRAPLVLIQSLAQALPDDSRAVVINLVDERVWNLTPDFLSYTISKAGLWTLTQTLALALAPRIRVNAVGPGPTLPSLRQTEEQFARQAAATPLGHGATPEEIGRAVRFILEARSMTGQMIALDGGQHLSWAMPGQPSTLPE